MTTSNVPSNNADTLKPITVGSRTGARKTDGSLLFKVRGQDQGDPDIGAMDLCILVTW